MKKTLVTLGILVAIPISIGIALFAFAAMSFRNMTVVDKSLYNKAARSGVPIVEAIFQYRNATELYPESFEDLKRGAALDVDTNRWSYEWQHTSARLEYRGSEVPFGLSYSFTEGESGWFVCNRLFEESGGMKMDAPVSIPPPAERTPDERYRLIVKEIQRRIDVSPTNAVHHQGLISHCVKQGQLRDALSFATRMHQMKLEPWWELQVLVRLLDQLHEDNWAEKEMRAAADDHPSFLPYFYLAWFYRESGNIPAAIKSLWRASEYPFVGMTSDHYVDDYYFWLATNFAYLEGEHDLVLAICDRWEANDRKRGYGSPNPQALRAAAQLAKGNVTEARQHCDRAIEMKGDRAIWAEHLDALSEAIRRGATDYRWPSGPYPRLDDYDILIGYQ